MATLADDRDRLDAGIGAFEKHDFSRAFELLEPLAESGDAKAQCNVALMYQSGLGVAVDGAKAVDLYRRAAAQNDPKDKISAVAYHNLGTIFSIGILGVSKDIELARQYWRKAAELGSELIPKEWYDDSQPASNGTER